MLALNTTSMIVLHCCLVVPRRPFTLAVAGARVSGLSVVMSKSSDAKKKKHFSLGQMASCHLPLIRYGRTHTRTNI